MAATIKLRRKAQTVPFRAPCASVNRTDSSCRLPMITSAQVEMFFDQARRTDAAPARLAA